MADLIQLRRDTAANWAASNPVLADGELGIDTTNRVGKYGDGSTAWASLPVFVQTAGLEAIYGTGADGTVSITGTTTLTRDMNYANLTVTGTLNTAGYRVFVNGALAGNGVIANNGGDGATAGTAGTAAASGFYGGGQAGGAGGTAAGTAGTGHATNAGVGSAGGAGGAGSGGAGAAAGTASQITAANWGAAPPNLGLGTNPLSLLFGRTYPNNASPRAIEGGTGGGGAGGDGGAGGGGGGGGGVCVVFARDAATYTGGIRANGGAGGNAAGTNRGGGGGGGGGLAALITATSVNASLQANGGAGGTKTGTGVAGTAGTAGVTLSVIA